MKVVAKFDDLEEWREFCKEYDLVVEYLGDDGYVCYNQASCALNPSGWFDMDVLSGEVDFDSRMK